LPAIFLDRDGVIIENRDNYVRSWSDVSIYPQALPALARIYPKPYKVVLITNQSAIGRGLISLETAQSINRQLLDKITQAGGRIDGVFMCPHAPEAACACRKPQPGLILQAAEALSLDLSASILIGDAFSDLLAGRRAGVKTVALVRTGLGKQQASLPVPAGIGDYFIYNTLADALEDLV
jgi:D-glycero-D-manno-heptose 1,7-bisphosphate phosphatase